jgi:hypothetical protein
MNEYIQDCLWQLQQLYYNNRVRDGKMRRAIHLTPPPQICPISGKLAVQDGIVVTISDI